MKDGCDGAQMKAHPPHEPTRDAAVKCVTPKSTSTELTGTMVGEWSVGLFDCFGDFGTCCLTFWCPCVTFGRIAEIVDKGSTCRMGREQQDGWVCARHESTRKARDVLLEHACMAPEFTGCDDSNCCINGFM
ncbi:hypothetical protein QYE76_029310 [Lolium multiflorum]|uniref:Uncharacterized protein n=1 Tax=Lolium multiflorum TaxID=4521 RepID=A0AAD8QQ78_LOLMU|nr:hypothetical protein QYE76_029310 [Lolium multiflorum]